MSEWGSASTVFQPEAHTSTHAQVIGGNVVVFLRSAISPSTCSYGHGIREGKGMSASISPFQSVVLLVDDTASLRESLQHGLESYGFRVVGAENGREALIALQRESVCCVITDLWMPEMSGEELVKSIRADVSYDGMPIVVMSAALDVRVTTSIPADGFLVKPFELEPLVRILDCFSCRSLH